MYICFVILIIIPTSQIRETEARGLNNFINWSLNHFFFLPEHVTFGLIKSWGELKTLSIKFSQKLILRKHNLHPVVHVYNDLHLCSRLKNKLRGQEAEKDQASYTLPSRLNVFNDAQTSSGIFLIKLINSCQRINFK